MNEDFCQCGGPLVWKSECRVCAACGGATTNSGKYLPPHSGWKIPTLTEAERKKAMEANHMLSFYLAARFGRYPEVRQRAKFLRDIGFKVTSRWMYNHTDGKYDLEYDDPRMRQYAKEDLDDVTAAEVLILFTEERGSENQGGGRFTEFGYALAQQKRCVVIGDLEMIFCGLPQVLHYKTWDDFVVGLIKGQIKPTLGDLSAGEPSEKIYPNTLRPFPFASDPPRDEKGRLIDPLGTYTHPMPPLDKK